MDAMGYKTTRRQMNAKQRQNVVDLAKMGGKINRPPICEGCGHYLSDPPSLLCVGCQAYQEHQR